MFYVENVPVCLYGLFTPHKATRSLLSIYTLLYILIIIASLLLVHSDSLIN